MPRPRPLCTGVEGVTSLLRLQLLERKINADPTDAARGYSLIPVRPIPPGATPSSPG